MTMVCAVWSWSAGAAAGWRFRVLLQVAAVKVVCACALELACWCHCRVPLQGAAARCWWCRIFSEAPGGVARGERLRRKDLCSQNTSSALAREPRFRIGKFEV